MVHAVSAFHERSGHMSPVAAALAALLHVATALALFLVSPLNRHDVDTDNAIEVTIEQPKPPEKTPEKPPEPPPVQQAAKPPPPPAVQPPAAQPAPPPPPAAAQKLQPQPQPQQASKEQLGLPPKGPVEPDKKPEAKLEPKPEPAPEPKAEPPQEAAAQPTPPTPPPPPEKPTEKALPPVEQPAAPLTMRDFVKVLPPPPAPPPSPPAHQPPQQHPQQPQSSPLSERPPPQEQREASVSSFQNPAAAYSHARVHDDYLVGIARKMSQYRFVPKSMTGLNSQGVVVVSLVVARDGRLLNSGIAKSSGNPPMDAAVLETAQKAAPYGPLPPEITGNSATFMLSVPYKFVAGQ